MNIEISVQLCVGRKELKKFPPKKRLENLSKKALKNI